ncbi:MAG: hypothetical protein SFW09_01195 [Hyphomicrobiaceae bacterium]|nr:hypothetical protein [Hyphomicrobiaceae bacterium]
MASRGSTDKLADWLVHERNATAVAMGVLLAVAIPLVSAALADSAGPRLASGLACLALGSAGWVLLTRKAGWLRRSLDTMVDEDRLAKVHGGAVDAFVVEGIKHRRRFGFERVLQIRSLLAIAALAGIGFALLPRADRGPPWPADIGPEERASAGGPAADDLRGRWVQSVALVTRGDAALAAGDPVAALGHFEEAGAIRAALTRSAPRDARLAAAAVATSARLAHVACIGKARAVAADHVAAAEQALKQSFDGTAASLRDQPEAASTVAWLAVLKARIEVGDCGPAGSGPKAPRVKP